MTFAASRSYEPYLPNDEDTILAQESSRKLGRLLGKVQDEAVRVQVLNDGAEPIVTLPAPALGLLLRILNEMAQGNAITLVPHHAELTTQQAADALNMSRPHFIKLLERGAVPFHKVGTHRRVLFRDVAAYKRRIQAESEAALEELAALSQKLRLDEIGNED